MSIVDNAISIGLSALASVNGQSVTYRRGNSIAVVMDGVVQGSTKWKGMGAGGMVVLKESVDWLIPRAALVDGGTELEPTHRDIVEVTVQGIRYQYDVQPFGPDELFWRWVDRSGRTTRRVFTKLLSEEAV